MNHFILNVAAALKEFAQVVQVVEDERVRMVNLLQFLTCNSYFTLTKIYLFASKFSQLLV